MANQQNQFKVRKGLIVNGSGSVLLDVQGSQGQLFSVTDNLSGSLFAVSDISGIPIMEVFSDDTIKMGTFGDEALTVVENQVGIGTNSPVEKLTVEGNVSASGIFYGDGSGLTNLGTAQIDPAGSNGQLQYNDNESLGGTSQLYYDDSNDRVGIGTSSPDVKLTVTGTTGGNGGWVDGILIENTASDTGEASLSFKNAGGNGIGSNYWFTGLNQQTDYRIAYGTSFTDANTLFTIETGGNVSINSNILLNADGTISKGSITDGFGSIDIGSSSLTAGDAELKSLTIQSFSADLFIRQNNNNYSVQLGSTNTGEGVLFLWDDSVDTSNPTVQLLASSKGYYDNDFDFGGTVDINSNILLNADGTISKGSITDGFGSIDIGSSSLSAGTLSISTNVPNEGISIISRNDIEVARISSNNSEEGYAAFKREGESIYSFVITRENGLEFGNGSSPRDTFLYRNGNQELGTNAGIDINSNILLNSDGTISKGSITDGFGSIDIGDSSLSAKTGIFETVLLENSSPPEIILNRTDTPNDNLTIVAGSGTFVLRPDEDSSKDFGWNGSNWFFEENLQGTSTTFTGLASLDGGVDINSNILLNADGTISKGSITSGFGSIDIGSNDFEGRSIELKNIEYADSAVFSGAEVGGKLAYDASVGLALYYGSDGSGITKGIAVLLDVNNTITDSFLDITGGTSPNSQPSISFDQSQITGTGALDAGSITDNFGSIDIGSSSLSAGEGTFTSSHINDLEITFDNSDTPLDGELSQGISLKGLLRNGSGAQEIASLIRTGKVQDYVGGGNIRRAYVSIGIQSTTSLNASDNEVLRIHHNGLSVNSSSLNSYTGLYIDGTSGFTGNVNINSNIELNSDGTISKGSITSGFGSIDIGSNDLTAGDISGTSATFTGDLTMNSSDIHLDSVGQEITFGQSSGQVGYIRHIAGGQLQIGSDNEIVFYETDSNTSTVSISTNDNSVTANTFIGSLTGNADTADAWSTARTITLGGDLTGNTSIDGSANVTLTATVTGVSANSVALGTDTTGNYIATISDGDGINVTGGTGEGSTPSVAVDSTVLRTTTSFGGDVSGTYDSIVIADDSHNHTISNIDGLQTALDGKVNDTGDGSMTGDYSTTGDIESGRGSGGVALTINDSQGNANVTFNHRDGIAEQAGNSARIVVNTDSTTGAYMGFELRSNNSAGSLDTIPQMTLTETTLDMEGNSISNVGDVDGRNISADGIKLDTIETSAKDDQTITAGSGLAGGGTGDVTLSVQTGDGIQITFDAVAVDSTVARTDTPIETFENDVVIQDKLTVEGNSNTIGGSNIANAWFLVGSTTSGLGIDNNEIYSKGSDLNLGTIDDGEYVKILPSGNLVAEFIKDSIEFKVNAYIGSGASNTAKIGFNTENLGSPQIELSDTDGDNFWSVGADDADNCFKIQGSTTSLPTINSGGDTWFEIRQNGLLYNSGNRLYATNYHPEADTWTTARTITLNGDVSGNVSIDGSSNVTLTATVPDLNSKVDLSGDTMTGTLSYTLLNGPSLGTRDKIRVWNSANYTIGMKDGYTYGFLGDGVPSGDFAMSFQMNSADSRGFWFGDSGQTDAQGAMSLTTDGRMVVATSLSVGEGEGITSPDNSTLYVDGEAKVSGDITSNASDERLKENVNNISNSLSKISKINGVEFDWKDSCKELGFNPSTKHNVGVLAQEIQKVLPEAVKPAPFNNDYLTVQYEKLTPLLIEGIKEQQGQIDELKTENELLKQELSEIKILLNKIIN